jgi:hypothetical protein
VTTAAMVFPLTFCAAELVSSPGSPIAALAPWLYPLLLLVTAIAFITPVQVRKPHKTGIVIMGVIGVCEIALMAFLLAR